MVKMSDARIFSFFFLERRVLRFHRGIVHPPAAIIDRATRADRSVGKPPFNRLVRGFLALLAFCYSFWAAAVSGAAVINRPGPREGQRSPTSAPTGPRAAGCPAPGIGLFLRRALLVDPSPEGAEAPS